MAKLKAQWKNLRAFLKLLDTITVYLLFLFLFIFCVLFIFSVNKFLLTIVNKNFLKIKCFKLFFFMQKQFSGGALTEEGVLWMCCRFSGAYLFVGVILTKLRSGFVAIALLHFCSPVSLLHVCGASFLENLRRIASERR